MIEAILELEEKNEFEKAFNAYQNQYNSNFAFEVWKHFFFFLWICIEDAPKDFAKRIDLRNKLMNLFIEGKQNFSEMAEFNFIAGYTTSIFPYEFGDYHKLEKESAEMLLKASKSEPENVIYKMVYLGNSQNFNKKEYDELVVAAKPIIQEKYKGIGFLNKYFKQVLDRKI